MGQAIPYPVQGNAAQEPGTSSNSQHLINDEEVQINNKTESSRPTHWCGVSPFTSGLFFPLRASDCLYRSQSGTKKPERIPLRSCSSSGWRSIAEPKRQHQLSNALQSLENVGARTKGNRFSALLLLFHVFWEVEHLIALAESQMLELKDWITYLISPLIPIETIVGKTILQETQPEGTYFFLEEKEENKKEEFEHSETKRLNNPTFNFILNKTLIPHKTLYDTSSIEETDSNQPVTAGSIVAWVNHTFPFIQEQLVYQELRYLTQCYRHDLDSNPTIEKETEEFSETPITNSVLSKSIDEPAIRLNKEILGLFLKKQLPYFLEEELDSTQVFCDKLKLIRHDITDSIRDIRLDIKHAYVTMMSDRLNIEPANSITLSIIQLNILFNAPKTFTILPYIIQTNSHNVPSNNDLTVNKLGFNKHTVRVQDCTSPPSSLSLLASPLSFSQRYSPLFPTPPMLPLPTDNEHITIKAVDIFLQRCLVDPTFFKSIWNQFDRSKF